MYPLGKCSFAPSIPLPIWPANSPLSTTSTGVLVTPFPATFRGPTLVLVTPSSLAPTLLPLTSMIVWMKEIGGIFIRLQIATWEIYFGVQPYRQITSGPLVVARRVRIKFWRHWLIAASTIRCSQIYLMWALIGQCTTHRRWFNNCWAVLRTSRLRWFSGWFVQLWSY